MKRDQLLMIGSMVMASCVGGVVTNLFMGRGVHAQGAQAVVTTRQVNIVDAEGNLRSVLTGNDDRAMASLSFYDEAGLVRGVFGVQPDGTPAVRFFGPGGETRLFVGVQGQDAVVIAGPDGGRQGIFGTVQGNPLLTFGENTRSRMQLHLTQDGRPRFALSDSNGEESVSLLVSSNDAPLMRLSSEGRPRVIMTVAQNASLLNLFDPLRPRLVVGVAENGLPSVSFLNESGEIVSRVP